MLHNAHYIIIYLPKLDSFAYISAAESIGIFFNHFYVIRPESYRIRWNYTVVRAITPFRVMQGHWLLYQSKARMRLPISD